MKKLFVRLAEVDNTQYDDEAGFLPWGGPEAVCPPLKFGPKTIEKLA